MTKQNRAVSGIYPDRMHVERVVEILVEAGFRNTDISVLFPENEGTKDFVLEKGRKHRKGPRPELVPAW